MNIQEEYNKYKRQCYPNVNLAPAQDSELYRCFLNGMGLGVANGTKMKNLEELHKFIQDISFELQKFKR